MSRNKIKNFAESIEKQDLSLDVQLELLYHIANKILTEGGVQSRIVKFSLRKHIESNDIFKKAYALNKIISNGKCSNSIPNEKNIERYLDKINDSLVDEVAKRYVNNKLEAEVEQAIVEKQDKYVDEVKLGIIRKRKGPENAKTIKKYEELVNLDKKQLINNIQSKLRPQSFKEIVGQERAIKALLSKIASPYPQHIILYGPPGVGKTTAARIALEEAKKLAYTPYDGDSKFVEVDGTTLRWDPREITNPLLGSVHDPIYQGSKREFSEIGVPEPKPGLVTEAHSGILFIDEIGELDTILQNKLLKVLEDKRVEFSSSYYDPDDENVPKYVKYLFEHGAPADFVLIGATTREPKEINPALRSRCTEVYFEPLTNIDIEKIVINAAEKINVELEEGVARAISNYTIEGRKAVNILSDVYAYVLHDKGLNPKETIKITMEDLDQVISISRLNALDKVLDKDKKEIGHIYGLGVLGYIGSTLEIEAVAFETENGKGTVRFNDTAGSMAKDSVFNAATVIRKITNKDIKDYDIHVNVVGGAKIDGPSAGAAITTCIISAILGKPIRQDVAITGEISLRGNVKPVGGIFEKIYGARRKGINLVIVPKDNEKEVPMGLNDIEVKSVGNIEEIMNIVF
ncbi:Lon family ATP-dependent protease [Hathewaya limosa]|uniref:endopeptidase La n=1 Tax=Hathewaya limosa TaxID=1536 RepID=A0ABU0JR44_HATLI|nr:Lon family ATP-dependent protease [Hathewaya limosa]AWZ49731.1 ATP-dependent protease, Lon family [Clostridiaceae bacterium 14S0207]MDQ0478721.1 ATP-dependent Lon protease [Hathewaya limosa]